MHVLRKDHIVDIVVWVDNSLPKQLPLTTSETVTILLFCSLLPAYSKFVEHCHKALPALMWREHGCLILSLPYPTQKKKMSMSWQIALLHARPKIECTFDYLKEHLLLVTSFPRSVNGYAVHYVRTLLAYQMIWGF